jgi:hypothetical protein
MPSPPLATCGNRLACQRHCSASRVARHRRRFLSSSLIGAPDLTLHAASPGQPPGMVAAPPKARPQRHPGKKQFDPSDISILFSRRPLWREIFLDQMPPSDSSSQAAVRSVCFQRYDSGSYGAAIDAVVIVGCKIAVTWMRLDHSELHWLAAPRAGVVYKNGQRHVSSFSPPAN